MKTYYGQMTKEQLNKTYYHAISSENAKAFAAMCTKAGYTANSVSKSNILLGVNTCGDNVVGWTDPNSTFYYERGLTRIIWIPEETKLTTDYLYSLITTAKTSIEEAEAEVSKWSAKVEEGKEELESLLRQLEKSVKDGTGMECRVLRTTPNATVGMCCEIPIPDSEGVDIYDPRTWKKGDKILCIDKGESTFVHTDEVYTFAGLHTSGRIKVEEQPKDIICISATAVFHLHSKGDK